MRRILLVFAVAAMMVMMLAAAGPAFAAPPSATPSGASPPCPCGNLTATEQAQGDFFTASTAVLAEPTNPNSLENAEPGLTKAFMRNTNP
jgi:hypothetical protein